MIKAKLHTLPSGLRVVLANMPDSTTTTVELLVETGSKYESRKEGGLSHFLEHMCFKGTEKRPSALSVSRDFDEIGAVSNAFTSTEVTGYWAKSSPKDLPRILDIVSDIYMNSVFKKEVMEREKGVIIEEINMYEDQPQAIVNELFDLTLHGRQPAGFPVIGNKESVLSFSAEDLYAYREKHYVSGATTVVVAGKFDEKEVLKQIKVLFKDISKKKKADKKKVKIAHKGPQVVSKFKETDQVHLILGMRSYPLNHKRNLAIGVMRGVLSSGMSSRLWQKMREELGICYYVRAVNMPSTDHGEFMIASGVDPKRVEIAVEAIIDELKRLKNELVPEDELHKVKTSMIAHMYMSLETSDAVSDYYASRAIFHKDLKRPSEREKDILSVTAEEVREVSENLFTDKDLLLAIVGKNINEEKLKSILTLL